MRDTEPDTADEPPRRRLRFAGGALLVVLGLSLIAALVLGAIVGGAWWLFTVFLDQIGVEP